MRSTITQLFSLLVLAFLMFPSIALAASLEEMAGQMIMVGFRGNSAADAGVVAVRQDIATGRIGGVIYLRHNIQSLGRVRAMNQRFSEVAIGLKPLIALDQEGGSIERLTEAVGFSEISSAARIAATQSVSQATQTYSAMAAGLADLGFNTNFGPVVDLNLNPRNPIIARYGRSFGTDSNLVAQYATGFISAHHNAGLLTALKHFPGHGSSRSDSHEGFVDISDYWQPQELDPYRALIEGNYVDMVMVGHLYHKQFSGNSGAQLPASLSPNWIRGVLRSQLLFDGVVISDDLEMGAIREHFSLEESVLAAVRAGTDILLFSNTANYRTGLAQEVVAILVEEAGSDASFARRIEQSYQRIVALKSSLPSG